MSRPNDLSRSLVPFEQDTTLVTVIELSQSSWLIAGVVPGVERRPLKKMAPDEVALLRLLHRWRDEAWHRSLCHPFQQCRSFVRAIALFDGVLSGFFDGLPATASRLL